MQTKKYNKISVDFIHKLSVLNSLIIQIINCILF